MIIPAGYAQVNIIWGGPDYPTGAQCTFGIKHTSHGGTAAEVATDVAGQTTFQLADFWGSEVSWDECLVKFGPNDTGPAATVPGGGLGTGGAASNWPAASVLVRKNTNFGGRKGRGRMFWPAPGDAAIDDGGQIQGTFVTDFNVALASWVAGMDGIGLPLYLLHADPSDIPMLITSCTADLTLATQRRRQRR